MSSTPIGSSEPGTSTSTSQAAPTIDTPAQVSSQPSSSPAVASEERQGGPRVKIGSQRPGSRPVQTRPQEPRSKAAQQRQDKAGDDRVIKKFEVPNIRNKLSDEMELEFIAALGDVPLDEILEKESGAAAPAVTKELEPDSRQRARVVQSHRDLVFVEMGGRNQGVLSMRNFPIMPEPGTILDVIVGPFNAEDGLYALSLPGGSVDVGDWSQVTEGMIVDARITGHNKGGLECEVNRLRGFIPISQVALYRVEDLAPFVGEKLQCVVTEANPEKRNLVLSRRDMLERERAESKEKLKAELAVGQVREGTVRSLRDFGAFVDLGGVDGLIHISQLSWQRVKHPSEVLKEGQAVKVVIRKIDEETGKISLSLRDLSESPWTNITEKYPVTSRVRGVVSKVMDFGAFVQLEPGVEGMVHISELSHGRVWRVADIVKEGDEVEAKILSVDPEQQRISLSIKAVQARPESAKKEEPEVAEEDETPPPPPPQRKTPLKGGSSRVSGGDQFGLKW
jgi:ribosomal protein S1